MKHEVDTRERENNIELVKAMDVVVRYMNNEDGIMSWFYLVPDEAADEDYESIAEDPEYVDMVCRSFYQKVKSYGKDGWYTASNSRYIGQAYGAVEND